MKKLLSVILALMVFASAASACTSEKKSSAEKKTPDYTKKEVNAYPHKSDKPMVICPRFHLPTLRIFSISFSPKM